MIQALPIPQFSWDFCLRSRMETFPQTSPPKSSPGREEPGLTSCTGAAKKGVSSLSNWGFAPLVMQTSPAGSRAEVLHFSTFWPVTSQAAQKNKAEAQIEKLCLMRAIFFAFIVGICDSQKNKTILCFFQTLYPSVPFQLAMKINPAQSLRLSSPRGGASHPASPTPQIRQQDSVWGWSHQAPRSIHGENPPGENIFESEGLRGSERGCEFS